MAWQRLAIVVEGRHAEALGEALEDAGAVSTEITDADAGTDREQALFGEPGADAGLWPRCRVSALFPSAADASPQIERALAAAGVPAIEAASVERVEDADWVALTQRQFEPIRAGARLWIVPTWHAPRPDAINVVLDPGAAFGTGSHPTTRLCLAWLEAGVGPGDRVLDYGCGSGILGIAALMLGAASATGVDVDPLALEAARYNSTRNGVSLQVLDAQGAIPGEATVTVANILANPLRMLAPVIAAHCRSGARLALSGILEAQAGDVIAAYAPFARMAVTAAEGGWVLVSGTVTSPPPPC